jgi:hypothetical protein
MREEMVAAYNELLSWLFLASFRKLTNIFRWLVSWLRLKL